MLCRDIFKNGYFYVNNAIFDVEISSNAKLVYMYLAKCADAMGKCWPAHKTIAGACQMSVTAIKAALKQLRDARMITISKRYREQGGKSSNLYMLMSRSKERAFMASVDIFAKEISSKAKLVYFYYCRCLGKQGTCFPSHKTTAEKCGVGLSTVRKALKELLDSAVVAVKAQFRADSGQTSNLYTVLCIAAENAKQAVMELLQPEQSKETLPDQKQKKESIESDRPAKGKSKNLLSRTVSRILAGSIGAICQGAIKMRL